jgi:hypothetical protein
VASDCTVGGEEGKASSIDFVTQDESLCALLPERWAGGALGSPMHPDIDWRRKREVAG